MTKHRNDFGEVSRMEENLLICEAIDRVEWEFSKIKSEKKLKKAVKLLEKSVKKILIDVEAT